MPSVLVLCWRLQPTGFWSTHNQQRLRFTVTTTALSPVDHRYLSPIYVPAVLAGTVLVGITGACVRQIVRIPALPIAVWGVLALWLAHPMLYTVRVVAHDLTYGAGGFHTAQWMNSALITVLKAQNLSGAVYTNEPYAVYALAGKTFWESPRRYKYESATATDGLIHFEETLRVDGSVYLVMFEGEWWQEYLYDADFFRAMYEVETVVSAADGAIYRVRSH